MMAARACTRRSTAVAEVGNPTIVATLTVVAALLPMLFVSGLMGPYMSPIPANASAAMVFSFFVAVILTPWLMMKIAGRAPVHHDDSAQGGGVLGVLYRRAAAPILRTRRSARRFLIGVGIATLASLSLFYFKAVTVKLLPFDNKAEVAIIADLPRGTSVEATNRVLMEAVARREGRARNPVLRELRRNRRAVQLQRSGAPLLHAQYTGNRRHPGQSQAQGPAQPQQPRDRAGYSPQAGRDRRAARIRR